MTSQFDDLVLRLWPRLVRSGFLLGHSREESEDLAQTTFLRVHRYWRKVLKANDIDAYVFGVFFNVARDLSARAIRERDAFCLLDGPTIEDNSIVQTEDAMSVLTALNGLSRDHREIVVLRYWVGLTESEASIALGLPVGTVKSRTSRALSALERSHILAEHREALKPKGN